MIGVILSTLSMSSRSKLVVTLVLIALLVGVGAADYYYSGVQYTASVPANEAVQSSSSSSQISIPAGAVAKNKGPDVAAAIAELQITP